MGRLKHQQENTDNLHVQVHYMVVLYYVPSLPSSSMPDCACVCVCVLCVCVYTCTYVCMQLQSSMTYVFTSTHAHNRPILLVPVGDHDAYYKQEPITRSVLCTTTLNAVCKSTFAKNLLIAMTKYGITCLPPTNHV